jgi:ribosomal protein L22
MQEEKQTKPIEEEKPEKKKAEEKEKPEEKKQAEKKTDKKIVEKPKKTTAIVNGKDLRISTKYSVAICKMIRAKTIEKAIDMLNQAALFKRPIMTNKMNVGHKPGKGIMAGKYPINTIKEFIRLLKQLQANAIANELELEKYVIFCKANQASRPYRRRGMRFKRTNLFLKLELKKRGGKK